MWRLLIICSIITISFSAYAELNLKPVNPDEPAEYTYNQRFSSEHALERLAAIDSALDSFRKLTEASKNKMAKDKLEKIGNTGWETQNLGLPNSALAIKGTILKQEYMIKKLTYDLAQRRLKLGEISKKELSEAQREYKKAEQKFQTFWDSFGIAD
ncbi:MAG: hypothetical protein PHN98_05235 [Smithellaceae bacterium]|nr:hypothetical protein [Smithellaceae bacterium]